MFHLVLVTHASSTRRNPWGRTTNTRAITARRPRAARRGRPSQRPPPVSSPPAPSPARFNGTSAAAITAPALFPQPVPLHVGAVHSTLEFPRVALKEFELQRRRFYSKACARILGGEVWLKDTSRLIKAADDGAPKVSNDSFFQYFHAKGGGGGAVDHEPPRISLWTPLAAACCESFSRARATLGREVWLLILKSDMVPDIDAARGASERARCSAARRFRRVPSAPSPRSPLADEYQWG